MPVTLKTGLLLLLLLAAGWPVRAQSRWQSFRKLSGPEKCWVLGHLWVAGKAQRVSARAIVLADSLHRAGELDGRWDGGLSDAFRHGIWMALLTREIGARKAQKLGKAHEKGNYRSFKKGQLEDGALADAAATEMDLWNNARGSAIADSLPEAGEAELIAAVRQAIGQGRLRMIRRDAGGRFLDREGRPIPEEDWKGKWHNPRSLCPTRAPRDEN